MAVSPTISPRVWAELALLSLLWGGTFLSVRVALDEIGPLTAVAHRVFWGALALWVVVVARRLPVPLTPRILIGFAGMGILNNVTPFVLQAWGQLHIETGLTAILNAGTAIWGVLVAAIFMADERLTARKLIGVILGFLGVATAIGLGNLLAFDARSLAQWAVIGSTISYAFAGVWGRRFLGNLSPAVAAAGMLTASALVMIPWAATIEGTLLRPLSIPTVLGIAYFALMATAAAYLLYYRVLHAAGASTVVLSTLLIAPVAIVLGAIVRGEALDPRAYAGFAVLAVGLMVLNGTITWPFRAQRGAKARQ